MKLLLSLLALVAICAATSFYEKNITFGEDENSIYINSPFVHKKIIVTQPKGSKVVEVYITGKFIPTRKIQYSEPLTQEGEILFGILREFQGQLDQTKYELLLNKVLKYVQKGQISQVFYDLLVSFDQYDQQTLGGQVNQYQYGPYSSGYGYPQQQQLGYGYGQQYQYPSYYYAQQYQSQGPQYENFYPSFYKGGYGSQYVPQYYSEQSYPSQYAPQYYSENQYPTYRQGSYESQYVPQYNSEKSYYYPSFYNNALGLYNNKGYQYQGEQEVYPTSYSYPYGYQYFKSFYDRLSGYQQYKPYGFNYNYKYQQPASYGYSSKVAQTVY